MNKIKKYYKRKKIVKLLKEKKNCKTSKRKKIVKFLKGKNKKVEKEKE